MRQLKRDMWKVGITLAGILLPLMLMIWVPVSVAGAQKVAPGRIRPVTVTVQATPTEDATVTELNKEKLAQEVKQLKGQNELNPLGWLQTNASILLSTLVVVIGALFGFWQWSLGRRDSQSKELEDRKAERERRDEEQKRLLEDRKAERERRDEEQQRWLKDQETEREKRAEERFQSVVEGLGSEREEARVGAAITLRTFLLPGYEQFFRQVFDLAVAHLRLPRSSKLPGDENIPLPLTTLSQALIVVFKEAFPLARSQNERSRQVLEATGIQLDSSYLESADLKKAWMPNASLRSVNLWGADLSESILWKANLSGAKLRGTNLSKADLWGAEFRGAEFRGANLSGASLRKTNLEASLSLKGADLRGVKGLTEEQLKTCKAKGAIIDETTMTSSSQPPVSSPLPSQSNEAQAQPDTSAQESTPTPDLGPKTTLSNGSTGAAEGNY